MLRLVRAAHGKPLVEGKAVTGFANTEEAAGGLAHAVPFLVEDELKRKDGRYSRGADWESHVVRDGLLIAGQNPPRRRRPRAMLVEALAEQGRA